MLFVRGCAGGAFSLKPMAGVCTTCRYEMKLILSGTAKSAMLDRWKLHFLDSSSLAYGGWSTSPGAGCNVPSLYVPACKMEEDGKG